MYKLVLGLSLSTAFFAGSAVTSWSQSLGTARAAGPTESAPAEAATPAEAEPTEPAPAEAKPEPEPEPEPKKEPPKKAKHKGDHDGHDHSHKAKRHRWEYTVVPFAGAATRKRFAAKNGKTLNEMGAKGWELTAVDTDNFYFRRAKR